jgi:hypothetical protein
MCTEGCRNRTFGRPPDLLRHIRNKHLCEHEDCEGEDQKFRDENEKTSHNLERYVHFHVRSAVQGTLKMLDQSRSSSLVS